MPIIFSLLGLAVCAVCLWILYKSGSALWKRRLREATEHDKKILSNDETVG